MSDPRFEALKRSSALQLLFKCARLANEQALEAFREATGAPMRPAHTTLLPHIDLEGTRQTEIASRVGVSKQAIGQLVDEMCEMGLLERVPDPNDGRAKLVRFADGVDGLSRGMGVLIEFDGHLAGRLGEARYAELRDTLEALEAILLAPGPEG